MTEQTEEEKIKQEKEKEKQETYKSILGNLYSCREIEISNLWQRSVMITAFLVLIYTAYGTLFMKYIDDEKSINVKTERSISSVTINYNDINPTSSNDAEMNLYMAFVCIAGLIFSAIWTAMAKASKAWQEVYENAIYNLEKKELFKDMKWTGEKLHFNNEDKGWWMGGYIFQREKDNEDSLFIAKAGSYSPSKLNILIGIVSMCIFGLLTLLHLIIGIVKYTKGEIEINSIMILLMVSLIGLTGFVIFTIKNNAKSKSLSDRITK